MPSNRSGAYAPLTTPLFSYTSDDDEDQDSHHDRHHQDDAYDRRRSSSFGEDVELSLKHSHHRAASSRIDNDYADPYAEPPAQGDEDDVDGGDGGAGSGRFGTEAGKYGRGGLQDDLAVATGGGGSTQLLAKLIPTNHPDDAPVLLDPESRPYRDRTFAVLYFAALSALLVTGVILLASTKSGPAEAIVPHSVYSTIKNSAGLLTLTTTGAVGICCIWLYLLRFFVRPVVLTTIYMIPVTCVGFFSFIVTNSALGKAHDASYLDGQYNGAIVGATGFLVTGFASAFYLYRRRRETEQTIHILQLSCDILRTNPGIFVVSIALTAAYTLFAVTWVVLFSRLFLRGAKELDPSGIVKWHLAGGTGWAVSFFVLMYFWTSAIFKNVEKVTVAGVVGEWYFQRPDTSLSADRTWKNFMAAVTTSFGSICLGSLILSIIQTFQFASRMARRATGTHSPLHRLLTACLDCGGRLADNVTSYALVYAGLTGSSFASASYATTRVFRRNLVLGLVTTTVTRLVLFVATATLAAAAGVAAFFFASRGLASPFAYVVGMVGAVVPWYLVQVLAHVVQNTVDATFMCYLLDVDINTVNCESAHRIFGTLVN
ncbi:hypothetical protein HKX48_000994 [Thoreauomyces humboldtii]|nr:hypothetical protein HKX48_000994 [Thoreauomyces humboldtii]